MQRRSRAKEGGVVQELHLHVSSFRIDALETIFALNTFRREGIYVQVRSVCLESTLPLKQILSLQ